jgi:hypothetical protein
LGVGEGDLGTVPLFLSQENRSGSGEREQQVHSWTKWSWKLYLKGKVQLFPNLTD